MYCGDSIFYTIFNMWTTEKKIRQKKSGQFEDVIGHYIVEVDSKACHHIWQ